MAGATEPDPPFTAVHRLRDAMNAHDPHAVAACFTTDYRCERPLRPSLAFVGSGLVERNWTGLLEHLPDLAAEVLRIAVDGEEIWSEWVQSGTNPAGATETFRGIVIMTLRGGLIDWTRFYLEPVAEPVRDTPPS